MKNYFIKISFLLLVISISSLMIVSCHKYPDGPRLSLHTRIHRIKGNWTCKEYLLNGVKMDTVPTFLLNINGNKSFSRTYGAESDSGRWSWGSFHGQINLFPDGAGMFGNNPIFYTEHYEIRRLKEKELWLRKTYTDTLNNTTTYDFHFE